MRTCEILIGAAIVAALGVVFYSGLNRRVEIVFLIAFAVFFTVTVTLRVKAYSGIANAGVIRTMMCWVFAYTSLKYVLDPRVSMLYAVHRHISLLTVRNFATSVLYVAFPVVCGVAWWNIWKKKPSARALGITASVGYILIFVWPVIFFPALVWWRSWGSLLIGTVGLIGFIPSNENGQELETEAHGTTWLKLS